MKIAIGESTWDVPNQGEFVYCIRNINRYKRCSQCRSAMEAPSKLLVEGRHVLGYEITFLKGTVISLVVGDKSEDDSWEDMVNLDAIFLTREEAEKAMAEIEAEKPQGIIPYEPETRNSKPVTDRRENE